MKAFVIDISKCNGCCCCQIVCKDEYVGNDWTPYAKPQPDTGQFWLKMMSLLEELCPRLRCPIYLFCACTAIMLPVSRNAQ